MAIGRGLTVSWTGTINSKDAIVHLAGDLDSGAVRELDVNDLTISAQLNLCEK